MFAKLLCRVVVATALAFGLMGAGNAQQVVRVGSTPTGIPFTFLDTKTNQVSGIMVDIIKEIGKDQGFTAEVSPMTFSTSQTSIITVAQLSFAGKLIASSTFKNTEIFTLVAVWYLVMCVPLILLVGRLEKKFGRK